MHQRQKGVRALSGIPTRPDPFGPSLPSQRPSHQTWLPLSLPFRGDSVPRFESSPSLAFDACQQPGSLYTTAKYSRAARSGTAARSPSLQAVPVHGTGLSLRRQPAGEHPNAIGKAAGVAARCFGHLLPLSSCVSSLLVASHAPNRWRVQREARHCLPLLESCRKLMPQITEPFSTGSLSFCVVPKS